jgi:Protein kinase domain
LNSDRVVQAGLVSFKLDQIHQNPNDFVFNQGLLAQAKVEAGRIGYGPGANLASQIGKVEQTWLSGGYSKPLDRVLGSLSTTAAKPLAGSLQPASATSGTSSSALSQRRILPLGTTGIHSRRSGTQPATALTWLRQALVGLGACHDRGLLHRDIKPANVFLETHDYALLGDFGMAVEIDPDGTAPGDGTTYTIAPEMLDGGRGTVRSDIYSVGVTGYRLLTGRWPFDGRTQAEVWAAARIGAYERVRDVAPHVSRRFAERIERAMALDPTNRFGTWREMHEELGRRSLVGNNWARRVSAEAGHSRCWIEIRDGGPRRLCVMPGARGNFDIEVRHSAGAQRRITAACRTAITPARLGVALRDVFDSL